MEREKGGDGKKKSCRKENGDHDGVCRGCGSGDQGTCDILGYFEGERGKPGRKEYLNSHQGDANGEEA